MILAQCYWLCLIYCVQVCCHCMLNIPVLAPGISFRLSSSRRVQHSWLAKILENLIKTEISRNVHGTCGSSKNECICLSLSISVLEVSLMTKKNKRYQFIVINIHTSKTKLTAFVNFRLAITEAWNSFQRKSI